MNQVRHMYRDESSDGWCEALFGDGSGMPQSRAECKKRAISNGDRCVFHPSQAKARQSQQYPCLTATEVTARDIEDAQDCLARLGDRAAALTQKLSKTRAQIRAARKLLAVRKSTHVIVQAEAKKSTTKED